MPTCRFVAICCLFWGLVSAVYAQNDAGAAENETAKKETAATNADVDQAADKPALRKLSNKHPIWFDRNRKMVIADGEICLRKGTLEMFACLKGTKEHESIIALPVKAMMVHAGLVACGAKPGTPVKFTPKFEPATGEEVAIYVQWKNEAGKTQIANARDWIRKSGTDETLETNWVFPGSYFWTDERTGDQVYTAEGGDLVCVSNFMTATLDLPIESSQENVSLNFEAFTERIPAEGTKVRVFFVPKFKKSDEKPASEKPKADPKAKEESDKPAKESPAIDEPAEKEEPTKKPEAAKESAESAAK